MSDPASRDAYVYRLESTLEWISDLVEYWAATHDSVAVLSEDPHYHRTTASNYRCIADAAKDAIDSNPDRIPIDIHDSI